MKGVPLYPVPLYELAGNGMLGLITVALWFAVDRPGLVTAAYLVGYAMLRCWADRYRHEAHHEQRASYRIYQYSLASSFAATGIAFGIAALARVTPQEAAAAADPWVGLLGIAPVAGVVSLLMALTYGVHVREVGRWFG